MRALLAVALLGVSFQAAACGVCVEDKIASCYDHAVVTRAGSQGDGVAFFAIAGPIVTNAETRALVLKAVEAAPGVRRGTARVSLENAALSFAYDSRRKGGAVAIADAVEKRIAPAGLHLGLLKVMQAQARR